MREIKLSSCYFIVLDFFQNRIPTRVGFFIDQCSQVPILSLSLSLCSLFEPLVFLPVVSAVSGTQGKRPHTA